MAQNLLKAAKKKITVTKTAAGRARTPAAPQSIALVGTYKEKQLAWIKKNGVYNYPVKDGDEFNAEAFAKINELWLYADAKGCRHCFAAEFVGKMSRDEFLAVHPTYANLGRGTRPACPSDGRAFSTKDKISLLTKSENREYYVFKTSFLDYGPRLDDPQVLIRAMDFATGRGRARLVKKVFDQYKADGEFAPLAAYLPTELSQVPCERLRVCEAAVQMEFITEMGLVAPHGKLKREDRVTMLPRWSSPKEQRNEKDPITIIQEVAPANEVGLTAVELFAGIGGFRVACDNLGIRTIWANDIDLKAAAVYSSNYGMGELHVGDINELKNGIPAHDILTGGFPCQPFSKAGKKQGVADIRGTLFEAIVDIVRHRHPHYFVLENVANLLSLDNGEHFKTILDALAGLGYMIEWKVFNAVKLGLPQHRLRILIVGTRDLEVPETYLLTEAEEATLPFGAGSVINDMNKWLPILDIHRKIPNWGMAKIDHYISYSIKNQEQVAPPQKLTDVLQRDVPAEFDFTEETEQRIINSVFVNKLYDGVRILWNQGGGARMGYSIFGTDGVAPTLTASSSRHYERYRIGDKFRRLTNIEYARIQGFPDNHCQAVSVYDQYKLFGNALPPVMARWVLNRIVHNNRRRVHVEEDLFNMRGE